jgi:formylglycine-generating enzyme required for sulfatase activity
VPLPLPLPDNPQRWDGWRNYNSPNFYERLCLTFDSNASDEQIEENCRILLVWWQKKLPLKNQPSNPVSQMLRSGLDEAPSFLAEARTALLDPEMRRQHDALLRADAIALAIEEFNKLIQFTLAEKELSPDAESRLVTAGLNMGLSEEEVASAIEVQLAATGAVRVEPVAPPPLPPPTPVPVAVPVPASVSAEAAAPKDPSSEFRRLLNMSRLCLDGEEMTDDQRDAMCNLGESLGLTGGEAEDLIDEYLERVSTSPAQSMPRPVAAAAPAAVRTAPPPSPKPVRAAPAPAAPAPRPAAAPAGRSQRVVITPLQRSQEREKYPKFRNSIGSEMLLIPSGNFTMGSRASVALANEQPITPVTISCFYMARFPITNVQYERFDPTHVSKRASWANEQHPVIYVSAKDAERFCGWLSQIERKRYRLPTEAEWEYAARGLESHTFPWGEVFDAGNYANFADAKTAFSWREPRIDDGWPQTSPVGYYPRGASPFGIEDLAGNVFEWTLDGLEAYKGKEVTNPRGPKQSAQRVYRGGSWKSRITSLRTTARAFNSPDYNSNDVGFRIVCECD